MAYHVYTDKPLGKKGVVDRIFTLLQEQGIIKMKLGVIYLDNATIQVPPWGRGIKKTDLQVSARSTWGLDNQASYGCGECPKMP